MQADSEPKTTQSRHLDNELVELALQGEFAALEKLLRQQQPFIYNLALYMLHHRQDAEDAAQEILVKVATSLSKFRAASSFKTWVRRIAINHLLDCRRSRPEQAVTGFGCYAEYLDHAPDDPGSETAKSPEQLLLVEEARISCTMGMLLCLDRNQRVVFLLGEILETSDVVAAELLEITRENFRQRLVRAREQLSSFMQGRCGLVNPKNSCRCAKKTASFIRDGIVDPARLQFAHGHLAQVSEVIGEGDRLLDGLLVQTREELRFRYPLFEAPDATRRLESLLKNAEQRQTRNPS